MRLRKLFLWSMIASLGAAALVGVVALVLPGRWEDEILVSVLIFAGSSIIALAEAVVLERGRMKAVMTAGLVTTALALGTWLTLIWLDRWMGWRAEERVARTGGAFSVAAIVIAQCGLLSLARFQGRAGTVVRRVTIAISACVAAYSIALIFWGDTLDDILREDTLYRMLGVLVILAACGTVVTPIIWKMESVRGADSAESVPLDVTLRLFCPRCGSEQSLRAGARRCGVCGLRIRIEIEEQRCACGYLLHRLTGDRCPECGRTVPEGDRWAAKAQGEQAQG